jgi:hypothetical protein
MNNIKEAAAVLPVMSTTVYSKLEGEAAYNAMLLGWVIHYNPPEPNMTDKWNTSVSWLVERSQAFPAPYGCYLSNGQFKNKWFGPILSKVLKQAISDMATSLED